VGDGPNSYAKPTFSNGKGGLLFLGRRPQSRGGGGKRSFHSHVIKRKFKDVGSLTQGSCKEDSDCSTSKRRSQGATSQFRWEGRRKHQGKKLETDSWRNTKEKNTREIERNPSFREKVEFKGIVVKGTRKKWQIALPLIHVG